MKKSLVVTLLFVVVALVACGDDDTVNTPPPPPEFEDLSERAHVLNNIEVAYNARRIDRYDELLDDNFTFFLSTGDVGGGLPAQWDRAVDIGANTNLFMADPPDPLPRCISVDMDILWEEGVTWIEIPAIGGETWYATTVFYNFLFNVEPDMNYLSNPGAKAQFTVRNAGTEETPHWRLVEMRDLGDPELVVNAPSATESSTWGQVKALYRD